MFATQQATVWRSILSKYCPGTQAPKKEGEKVRFSFKELCDNTWQGEANACTCAPRCT